MTVTFHYGESDLPEHLKDPLRAFISDSNEMSNASLQNETGRMPLVAFITHCGVQAFQENLRDKNCADQDVFDVTLDMSEHRNEGSVIRTARSIFPVPEKVVARFRIDLTEQWLPERRFRLPDTEIVALELPFGDSTAQTTIFAEPQPDGTRKIVGITLGAANPSDVKVSREP